MNIKIEEVKMSNSNPSKSAERTKTSQATWPDFAAGLYDKLTGKGSEITYEFTDFSVYIPSRLGEQTDHFHWRVDGTLNIRTGEKADQGCDNENG
jgi:hypothetical protein